VKRYGRRIGIAACAAAALSVACDTGTGVELSLDDLSEPDTNTVVVVLSRPVQSAQSVPAGGVEHVYAVRTDRIPHTLLGEIISGADTSRVAFVLSELYDAGPVVTDGIVNVFYWTDLGGQRYDPVDACVLDVVQPYVFGTPSVQRVETVCRVRGEAGEDVTVYAKGMRFSTLGGATTAR